MNLYKATLYATIFACSMFALSHATVGGQYSVNVHFVPPLVTAPCTIAQFWSPPNVTCAMCFCMTGTLSRCIPQPGCNPNAPINNNNGTGNSTDPENNTQRPEVVNSTEAPEAAAQEAVASDKPKPTEAPPKPENTSGSQTTEAPAEETPTESPTNGTDASSGSSSLRGAKPGKPKRRRRALNESVEYR